MQNMNKKMLKIVYGDCPLGVSGITFLIFFLMWLEEWSHS